MSDTSPRALDRRAALRRLAGMAVGASPAAALLAAAARPLAASGALPPAAGPVVSGVRAHGLALAITGGRAYLDGVLRAATVGVTADGRLRIVDGAFDAERTVDATGKVVSPGFIDILGDNSADPKRTYFTYERFKLTDGVTTALQMHGGASDAGEFHAHFGELPHFVNFGVSTKVMNLRHAHPTHAGRLRAIERSLDGGALGVSHSLEYQRQTTYAEVVDYARVARRYDRPMVLHLRHSSQARELDGVREALQLARDSGARVHIAHLHSTGGTFDMPGALELIRRARAEGAEVTTCVYPYSYWATYLHSQRFDPGWQERFGLDYGDLTVVGTGERLTAATFAEYRRRPGILVSVPEGTMPLERTVDLALREPFTMIGSDGGIEREPRANSHPRGAGCFATALRRAQDTGLGLEQALATVTSRPAELVGLDGRGALRDGWVADVTVFDPAAIRGRATVANPNQYSDGISLVLVAGQVAYEAGRSPKPHGRGITAQQIIVARSPARRAVGT